MNAFTGHELTAFYVRLPDRHLELAIDILSDILWRPALRPDDVESERQVILEEIGMRDDTPDDLVHDLFTARSSPTPTRSRGRRAQETIEAMPRDAIAEYHHAHYQPANIVVAAAGNLDHDDARRNARTAQPERGSTRRAAHQRRRAGDERSRSLDRPPEQAHVVLGACVRARRPRP